MLKTNYIKPATLLCDFYKVSHRAQYPKGTEKVYSTWTPRASRIEGIDHVVAFGFQAFIQEYLVKYFDKHFFSRSKEAVCEEYVRVIKYTLGDENPDYSHIAALHDLGYMPLKIKAVKEGTLVPLRVPMLTIENTQPEFFWLTNYIETLMSCQLWMPTTSATIAFQYRKILQKYASETNGDTSGVQFQGHDFSMRGMACEKAAEASGAGHLLSFVGTDTIPAILFLEEHYGADIEKELVGTSIPATEHSVMCAYGRDELDSYRHIIEDVYPKGFVSIVSDTWNLWDVLHNVIEPLKDVVMGRDGRVVIRPDSGDPVNILCGDPNGETEDERKGVVEILWEIFGGEITEMGYRQLDTHIGCIYGDAITLTRCEEICKRLKAKNFASTNVVYGIGSYTYQCNTRDTFGFALKSTYAVINGQEHQLYKDPVTDKDKIKKSQTGLVAVVKDKHDINYIDGLTEKSLKVLAPLNLLETVYYNGTMLRHETLSGIRERLLSNL